MVFLILQRKRRWDITGLLKEKEIKNRFGLKLNVNSTDKVECLVHTMLGLKVKGVVKTIHRL